MVNIVLKKKESLLLHFALIRWGVILFLLIHSTLFAQSINTSTEELHLMGGATWVDNSPKPTANNSKIELIGDAQYVFKNKHQPNFVLKKNQKKKNLVKKQKRKVKKDTVQAKKSPPKKDSLVVVYGGSTTLHHPISSSLYVIVPSYNHGKWATTPTYNLIQHTNHTHFVFPFLKDKKYFFIKLQNYSIRPPPEGI